MINANGKMDVSNMYFVQLDLVKTSVSIIACLCEKGQHVRNFAIDNHKAYKYCMKAYKCFGLELKE
jgi:hypothetical protein